MATDGKIYGTTVATSAAGVFMAGVKSPYGPGDDVAVPAALFGGGTTPIGLVSDGAMTYRASDGGGDLTGTDNTSAIQAAVTLAASTGGGTVNIPAGRYRVYNLTVPSNVRIVGAGIDQTFFYTKYATATDEFPRPTGATFTGSYSSLSGVTWVTANDLGGGTFGSHIAIGNPDVAIGSDDTIKRGNIIRECKLISYGPNAGGNHAIDQYGWVEDSLIEDIWLEGQFNYACLCHWSGDFGVSINSSRATKSWHPHNITFRRIRGTCATYKGNIFHLASSGRVVYEDCDVDGSELYTLFYGDAGCQFAQNITPEEVLANIVYRHCTGTTDLLGFQGTANSNPGGNYITYGALKTVYGNDRGNRAGATLDQCSINIRDYPGVTVGATLTIAGVSNTKTVEAISGNLVTLDAAADATVSDAAVTFTSPVTTTVAVLSPISGISNIHFQVADASSFRNAMNITISGVSGTRLITQIWGNTIAVSTAVTGIAVGATVTQIVLGSITSGEKYLRLSSPTSQTFTGTGAQETNLLTVSSTTGLFVGVAISSTTLVSGETYTFVVDEINGLILTLDRNLPAAASSTTFTTTGGTTRVLPIVYSFFDNLTINNFECRYSDTAAATWAAQIVAINTVAFNGGHLKSRFGIRDRLVRDFEVNGTILEGVHTDVETTSIGLAVTNTAPQTVTTVGEIGPGDDELIITTLTATTFTGTGSSGSTELTVSSAAGLSVGNTISSATLVAGSTQAFRISAINGLVLTLATALTGAASGTTFTLTTPLTVGLYPGSMVYYSGNYYEVDGVTTPEDYVFHGAGTIPIKLVKLRADDTVIPAASSVKLIPLTRRAIMRSGAIRGFNIGAYAGGTGTNYEEFLPSFVMDGTSIEDCGIQAVKLGQGVKSSQLLNLYLNGNGRASYSTAQGLGVSLNEGDIIIDGLVTGSNELEPYAIYTGTVHKSLTIANSHIETHSATVANSAAIYLPANPTIAPEVINVSFGAGVTQQVYPTTAFMGARIGGAYRGTGTAAPTTGTWVVGDEIQNRLGTGGWHCTASGTPGTWNRFVRNYKGADITAASPLVLDNRTGDIVDVTGNTGFSAVTLAEGQECWVRFTGTPTITVGASLIGNKGGGNITIAAGDMAYFRGYAAGVVRFWVHPISGAPPLASAFIQTLLDDTSTNVARVTLGIDAITTLASSATTNISDAANTRVLITGTTNITGFGTDANSWKLVEADTGASFRMTPNGTTAKTWNGYSIQVLAGDTLLMMGNASGDYNVALHEPAAGRNSGYNYFENAAFDVWQRNTTFALASGTVTQVADRWKARRGAVGHTVSRQAGFSGATYCLRSQRDAADSATTNMQFGQQIESTIATALAGKWIRVSFYYQTGADFSATAALTLTVYMGTGTDEAITNLTAFPTGPSNSRIDTNTALSAGVSATRYVSIPFQVTAGTTEIFIGWTWTPVGTAGAADYLEVTNCKLELGQSVTPYEKVAPAETLSRCQRHYRKSFAQGTAPAQNVGAGTGEFRMPATVAGAAANTLGSIQFGSPMRAAPTITTYNPAAANAQVRDLTSAADCSATATANVTDSGFEVTCTANAGTAVGETLGIHWSAEIAL